MHRREAHQDGGTGGSCINGGFINGSIIDGISINGISGDGIDGDGCLYVQRGDGWNKEIKTN